MILVDAGTRVHPLGALRHSAVLREVEPSSVFGQQGQWSGGEKEWYFIDAGFVEPALCRLHIALTANPTRLPQKGLPSRVPASPCWAGPVASC